MEKNIAELVLKSRKSEINKLEKLLLILNSRLNIDQDRFINFHIAASEAIVNAIIHGNKESPDKWVYVSLDENDDEIILTVRDEGNGFDICDIPDPTKHENLIKEHGRGIFIMKQLTDGYECYTSEKGTVIKLFLKKHI